MGKSQIKKKPVHEVLRLTRKNLRHRDTVHSEERKRLGSPKGYISPAKKIYRFSSKNSPRTQNINFVNSALNMKGVMENQNNQPTMAPVLDKKLQPFTFDKPLPPFQNETKYKGNKSETPSEDVKKRTPSNESGPPPIVQKSRRQKKEKQRVERETPIQQSRRLRQGFYHQSYIQNLNTKHPNESYSDFHKRKGMGLTYYMALANQLKKAPQLKCEKKGKKILCPIQGGKKKKRKRKTKRRHRTKRRVKKHRKRKTRRKR